VTQGPGPPSFGRPHNGNSLRARDALAQAKHRCRYAYKAARTADPPLAALLDRWFAETLIQVDGVHPDAARLMLTRIAIMFEVVADRRGWPDRLR
jgi:hypothetical protein